MGFASLLVASAGCSAHPTIHAAKPIAICGETLSHAPAGAAVYDFAAAESPRGLTITDASVGGLLYIRVSADCAHGSTIRLAPPDAVQIVRRVAAKDGLAAALVLRPKTGVKARVVALQSGSVVGRWLIDVS